MTAPITYTDDIETPLPDEDAVVQQLIDTMQNTASKAFEEHRHAMSSTHAKSHGIVTGTLTVLDDLPPELAQGLFAKPATYDVVLRYASEPGALDPDTVARARGAALKVMNVADAGVGEMMKPGWSSQDFLFNTWPIIGQGDAKTYLDAVVERDKHHGNQLATAAGTLLHHRSGKQTLFDRTPNIHPVAFTYYSQGAFRYGEHVAKFALAPATTLQHTLAENKVKNGDPPGILKDWVRGFFAENSAGYEFQVQLLTDPESMPVEDASVEWPEEQSPYRTVATLELPAQESFSPARRVYAEDVMSWRIWNGLAAFRPLGSINRLRRRVYDELGALRHQMNARQEHDPISRADVPD